MAKNEEGREERKGGHGENGGQPCNPGVSTTKLLKVANSSGIKVYCATKNTYDHITWAPT